MGNNHKSLWIKASSKKLNVYVNVSLQISVK